MASRAKSSAVSPWSVAESSATPTSSSNQRAIATYIVERMWLVVCAYSSKECVSISCDAVCGLCVMCHAHVRSWPQHEANSVGRHSNPASSPLHPPHGGPVPGRPPADRSNTRGRAGARVS
jgi:hypothetical protein